MVAMSTATAPPLPAHSQVWWSNASFFSLVHIAAIMGVYYYPIYTVPRATLLLTLLTWQLSMLGLTVGYHRLWSHRTYQANILVRFVLAILGSAGVQGSIKWWCLRHRMHHRFADDPIHDPYAPTLGLVYAHAGWIFFKPNYSKMNLVDRKDLDKDPIVRFQHKHYVLIALFTGFVFPLLMGYSWDDPKGSFIWAGLVSRLLIWHSAFLINSLAHWDGLQPYSDENTSRGNLILALVTGGEGNHNFHHAFPYDFRSGNSPFDFDPTKWTILALSKIGLATGLRRAHPSDIKEALTYMNSKVHGHHHESEKQWNGPCWTHSEVKTFAKEHPMKCILLIEDFVVDATKYLRDHPGGASIIRDYSFKTDQSNGASWKDATWAFRGGLNNHSRIAQRQLKDLRVAQYSHKLK